MIENSAKHAVARRDVFVSHAAQDAAVADAVVAALEKAGIGCWIAPRDIAPGSQHAEAVAGAINDAKVAVLVLSQHAIGSSHVGKEIERSSSKRRRVIALRTDASQLTRSFEYFLREAQWIDVASLGMPGALAKLAQAVGQDVAASPWISPGLGADARAPADHQRKPRYSTIKRAVSAMVFFAAAAIAAGVLIRYWPAKPREAPPRPSMTTATPNSRSVARR